MKLSSYKFLTHTKGQMPFMHHAFILTLATIFTPATAISQDAQDPLTKPIESSNTAKWLKPQKPFRIYGNTYYVGFGGLSNVLIQTNAGLILIDGALPQSVASLEDNIKQLGFRVEDIKFILSTEPHFDHAGGIAALARDSGAITISSPLNTQALLNGHNLDTEPQAGELPEFPAVKNVRNIKHGEIIRLGNVQVKAHFTPGHSPGSTSWSWNSCEQNQCLNVVFGSSLTSISAEGFHFSDKKNRELTTRFKKGLHAFAKIPCDVLISAHPEHSGADKKMQRWPNQTKHNPFIDALSCQKYVKKFGEQLNERLVKEKLGTSK